MDDGGKVVKSVRLNRKTCPATSAHVCPDRGLLTSKRWKRLHLPASSGSGEERWASLALGLVEFPAGCA